MTTLPTADQVDLAVATRMLTIRPDGRYDVADDAAADALFGCSADEWCILQDGHEGGCDGDREVHVTTADLATPPVCRACGAALTPRPLATQTATQKATGGWWDHPGRTNQSMIGHTRAVNLPPTSFNAR